MRVHGGGGGLGWGGLSVDDSPVSQLVTALAWPDLLMGDSSTESCHLLELPPQLNCSCSLFSGNSIKLSPLAPCLPSDLEAMVLAQEFGQEVLPSRTLVWGRAEG